jgi:hypothetical protein
LRSTTSAPTTGSSASFAAGGRFPGRGPATRRFRRGAAGSRRPAPGCRSELSRTEGGACPTPPPPFIGFSGVGGNEARRQAVQYSRWQDDCVRARLGVRLCWLRGGRPPWPRKSGRLAVGKPREWPSSIWPLGIRVVAFTFVPVTVRVPACQQSARRWSIGPDAGGCAAGRVDFSPPQSRTLWTADSETVLAVGRRPSATHPTSGVGEEGKIAGQTGGKRREADDFLNSFAAPGYR